MAHHTMTSLANRVAWIDLATDGAAAARDFYSRLFGWDIEVSEDPQYGGYALARLGGEDAAGMGPKQDPNAPTAWSTYFGSDDLDTLARKVADAGGSVVMAPFDVGDQGRMAVFQDPTGAFFSAWEGARMGTFKSGVANAYGWSELNARGREKAIPFYTRVFGWTTKEHPGGDDQPPYVEFYHDGHAVGGALEINPMIPPEVPGYWQVFFKVDDVDASFEKAVDLGAREMVAPSDYPGGRFAILTDPQGAGFGIYRSENR